MRGRWLVSKFIFGGVSRQCRPISCNLLTILYLGKYLPALKCLLTLHQLEPNHPKCHEQGGRFKLATNNLSEPLPPQVKEVVDSSYLSKLSSKSLEECNEEYLASHKDSAPHIHSVIRFRNVLKPGADDTTENNIRDLQATLAVDSTSLQDAVDGLQLLEDLALGPEARQKYVQAAQKRYPVASAFKS